MSKRNKLAREKIGSYLAAVRKERGMTQQQVGDRIGKDRHFVSNLERGIYNCSLDIFLDWLGALDMHIDIRPQTGGDPLHDLKESGDN